MDDKPFSANSSVVEVLRSGGPVDRVFIRHRTACVGCSLARFCTVNDVAATYGLELEPLVAELEGCRRAEIASLQRSNS